MPEIASADKKNILVGTGFSEAVDAFQAAKEAAEQALKGLDGKKPTISYVFFSGKYDPYKLNDGLMAVLGGTEFVGGSADAVFYDEKVAENGVVAASLFSEYLHIGVASSDNVSEDPYAVARKTTLDALAKLPVDKYLDPYLLFTRMKKTGVKWLVKIPSFFVFMFSRGMKLPKMGDETKIIKGISEEIGLQIPMWGGSFGTSLQTLFSGNPYEIYALHSGKVMKDGLIIMFNSCSLLYGESIAHGCKRTDNFGFISKTAGDGYLVKEISGEPPVEWYSKQLNMDKQKFLEQTMVITQRYPLGIPDNFGNFIIRAGGAHNTGMLGYVAPFVEGWPAYVMDANPENLLRTADEISNDIMTYTKETSAPAICLANLCASRRVVLQEKLPEELKKLKSNFKGAPVVGFSCFGEIGAKPGHPASFNHVCANIFVLYDKLLHEIK